MLKTSKNSKVFALIVLTSMLLMVAAVPWQNVNAATTYTVSMFSSCAGSTTPVGSSSTGVATYTYNAGSSQTFTATPSTGFTFLCWVIGTASGPTTNTTNPLTYTVNSDIGLQPIFIPSSNTPIPTPPATAKSESVLVFASYGGSSTPTGTSTTAPYVIYNYNSGSSQSFTATPGSGFKLLCWLYVGAVGGSTTTQNPASYTIAESAAIQPIFIPTSSTVTLPGTATPTPSTAPTSTGTSHFSGYTTTVDISIAIVIIIVVLIIVALLMRARRQKKI